MLRVGRRFDMQRDGRRMQQRVVDQAMLDGILQTLTLFGSERHWRINANYKIIQTSDGIFDFVAGDAHPRSSVASFILRRYCAA
jgi:hypothetical protein